MADGATTIGHHLRRFFAGHPVTEHVHLVRREGVAEPPTCRVLAFAPGPRFGGTVYATASPDGGTPRREFVLAAARPDVRHVELVTMAAWYHQRRPLDVGHTVPIGEPWLPGSSCTHLLVSLPYPFGPALEHCPEPDDDRRVFWLLPITAAERDLKVADGSDALESRFDAAGLRFWDAGRASVV